MSALAYVTAVVGAFSGDQIATNLRQLVGPLVLVGISLVAVYYLLIVRQPTKFIVWMLVAVAAGIFFYDPAIVQSVSEQVGGWLK